MADRFKSPMIKIKKAQPIKSQSLEEDFHVIEEQSTVVDSSIKNDSQVASSFPERGACGVGDIPDNAEVEDEQVDPEESPDFKLFTEKINEEEESKIPQSSIPESKTNAKEGRYKAQSMANVRLSRELTLEQFQENE